MAKKMRTINNPLDRQARNDFNYNFQAIDENFSETNQNLEVNVTEIKERLDEALDGRQLEELFEAAADARSQANEARIQASKAENQAHHASKKGDYANEQGDYAKEQGDYANEKGLLAAEIVGEAEEAVSDLSELKIDVVESTQHANRQGDYAKEQADRAAPLVQKIEEVMPHLENMEHKEQWSEVTTYLKNQFVRFNGSTYQAKIKNKGQMPPVNDDGYWRLIAQRGTDGEGAVGSVNGILPDEQGNVDLGDFATKEYVNAQIDGIEIPEVDFTSLETKEDAQSKLLDAKAYTDEEIAKIPAVDLSKMETKVEALAKLNEAKEYTDTKVTNMETTSGAQEKVSVHAIRTDNPHKVTKAQVGLEKVINYGISSKSEAEVGSSNNSYMTPLRTREAIEKLSKGISLSDIPLADDNVAGLMKLDNKLVGALDKALPSIYFLKLAENIEKMAKVTNINQTTAGWKLRGNITELNGFAYMNIKVDYTTNSDINAGTGIFTFPSSIAPSNETTSGSSDISVYLNNGGGIKDIYVLAGSIRLNGDISSSFHINWGYKIK